MLRRPNQNWRSCKNLVYYCKLLPSYIVTNFLLVKIFLSVPCIHYNPMKLNLASCSALSLLSSWWQQPLGKTYGLRCQNRVMVSFVFSWCWGWGWRWPYNCFCDWMRRNKLWMIQDNMKPNITLRLNNRLYYTKVAVGN